MAHGLTVEDLHRLLDRAHSQGVRILHVAKDPDKPGLIGAQVSSSRPDMPPYTVLLTGPMAGCDCDGYERHGRCKHFALTVAWAGWLPELAPEPEEAEHPPLASAPPRSARLAAAAAHLAAIQGVA